MASDVSLVYVIMFSSKYMTVIKAICSSSIITDVIVYCIEGLFKINKYTNRMCFAISSILYFFYQFHYCVCRGHIYTKDFLT